MKNRSRTDLIASILEVTSRGEARKTKIMYEAFLSYMQLKEYLLILEEKDLIKYQGSERTSFITTEKGRHFLNTYNKINKMIAKIRRE